MKVALLPYNTASDLSHKVRSLRSLGVDARGLALGGHAVQSADDIELVPQKPGQFIRNRIRRVSFARKLKAAIDWADVIHWMCDFGSLPYRVDKSLAKHGRKPGIIQWAGSDIRIPEYDFDINPFYKQAFFNGYEYCHESLTSSMRNQRDFADLGFYPAEFIGMGRYIDRRIFPKTFRVWQSVVLREHPLVLPDPAKTRPLIVHSPTAPVTKGTRYILEAVDRLKLRYEFDFQLVQNMPRRDALQYMAACDIYVDQLILGVHGSAAVEAMAFGKPVVCYINPVIGSDYPHDLPLVKSDPVRVYDTLEGLINKPLLRSEIGARSRTYVEKYHEDTKVAGELVSIYEEVLELHHKKRLGG